ncbi:MAG: hypothetical protein QHI48_01640 [Bacteroidota bacterium]|nr:hypothetical protein [Bacteroidota bacterium]
MHLIIIVKRGYEGFDVTVPSIPECASWGSSEEQALDNILDRIAYFFGMPVPKMASTLEFARREGGTAYYTLVLKRGGDLTEPIQEGDEDFPI